MYRFTRKIQYSQIWCSQAVGIGSYDNRTPHTSTHAAQLHSSLSQKHNTFCEGLNGSILKSFHFGAYESELVMAALSGPVVTWGGATLFCLKMLLPARPAAALPGSSRHGHKHWPRPWDTQDEDTQDENVLSSWVAAFIHILTWYLEDSSRLERGSNLSTRNLHEELQCGRPWRHHLCLRPKTMTNFIISQLVLTAGSCRNNWTSEPLCCSGGRRCWLWT